MQQHESKPPPKCIYPQSNATARDIQTEIDAIAANQGQEGHLHLVLRRPSNDHDRQVQSHLEATEGGSGYRPRHLRSPWRLVSGLEPFIEALLQPEIA